MAILVADHEAHAGTLEAVRDMRLGLAGHAWFETYSVLTRLPGLGLAGGAVSDALVGSVAVVRKRPLLTRDRWALGVYRALDVDAVLLD